MLHPFLLSVLRGTPCRFKRISFPVFAGCLVAPVSVLVFRGYVCFWICFECVFTCSSVFVLAQLRNGNILNIVLFALLLPEDSGEADSKPSEIMFLLFFWALFWVWFCFA